jgi:hypothetical protein
MNNMKRLSLALVALGLSAPAFADSTVLVPSQHGGFKVGIDALYLRPTNSDLNYATSISQPTNFSQGFERNATVDPSYDWGFYAQVGYLFPCTGNDLTLAYTYLRSDETDSVVGVSAASPASGTIISVLPIGQLFGTTFGTTFGAAAGKAKFDLNVVDLEGGQRFTTGAYDMRMFAGLRYANIDHQLQSFGAPFATGSTFGAQEFKSQFRGLGPRIGVDGRYCLNSGFGVDANLSTALLIGHVDGSYNAALTTGTGDDLTVTNFAAKNGSENRVVPVLEGKLGVDYTYIMDCRCKSALTFEAGYQATNYFNADDHARVVNTGGTSFNYQNNTSDVAFDGIYFGVKYYA